MKENIPESGIVTHISKSVEVSYGKYIHCDASQNSNTSNWIAKCKNVEVSWRKFHSMESELKKIFNRGNMCEHFYYELSNLVYLLKSSLKHLKICIEYVRVPLCRIREKWTKNSRNNNDNDEFYAHFYKNIFFGAVLLCFTLCDAFLYDCFAHLTPTD